MEKPKKGLIPTVKSFLFGDPDFYQGQLDGYVTQSIFQILTGTHSFNRKALLYLVETGYSLNPVGYGIINKILLAQRNIVFAPYKNGQPYKQGSITLDFNFGLQMLLTTGTLFIHTKKIVGFKDELDVLNTLNIMEINRAGVYQYQLLLNDGSGKRIILNNEDLIIIKLADISNSNTQMGLSPLQAALMPIESLKEMYLADTSTLKNKGVDALVTNDTEMPIVDGDKGTFDEILNSRISGARRAGGVATSTAKLRVLNLGRTTKELALWDGYKIKMRDLCNVLQIDSGQFNDPDNKKFSNVQDSNKALYNDCVIPFTRIITENKELTQKLGFEIFLDTSNIDVLQQAQSLRFEKNKTITDVIINLNNQVKNGIIDWEIAVEILVDEWNFDRLEAEKKVLKHETIIN